MYQLMVFKYLYTKVFILLFYFFVLFSNKTETFSDASSVLLIYSKFGLDKQNFESKIVNISLLISFNICFVLKRTKK